MLANWKWITKKYCPWIIDGNSGPQTKNATDVWLIREKDEKERTGTIEARRARKIEAYSGRREKETRRDWKIEENPRRREKETRTVKCQQFYASEHIQSDYSIERVYAKFSLWNFRMQSYCLVNIQGN